MIIRNVALLALLGLVFAGGCAPYVDGFHYLPNPAVADIRSAPAPATTQPAPQAPAAQETPVATASAVVVGVRREDSKEHLPLSVEIRLRIDNHGPKVVALDPRSLDMTTSALVRFPAPIINGPEQLEIQPGQTLFVQANFPFPPGASFDNMDLRQLQLHWAVLIDGQPIAQEANFQRAINYYYDPYWERPYYGSYYYGYPFVGIRGRVIIR